MRPKGSAAELQARRLLAGQLLLEGSDVDEVAEIVGASESSVRRWRRAVEKGGLEALLAKPHPGRKPRLDAKQKQRLIEILLAGPRKAGYSTDLWTCRRVAEVIAKKFQVKYHPDHVGKMLHDLGWTCQKPEQQAREADDAAIQRWRKRDWPRIKRGPSVAAAL
jgi:transposase